MLRASSFAQAALPWSYPVFDSCGIAYISYVVDIKYMGKAEGSKSLLIRDEICLYIQMQIANEHLIFKVGENRVSEWLKIRTTRLANLFFVKKVSKIM